MKENLMFGCLGNGITVADRNREYLGDYATVDHIAENGLVRIYCQFLSQEALDSINSMASKQTDAAFKRWEQWSAEGRVSVMDHDLSYDAFSKLFKKHDLFHMTAEDSFSLFRQAIVDSTMYEMQR